MLETPSGHFFPAEWRLPFGIVEEFLVYKDPASRETWLSIPNTMIELRCHGDELEVVLDDSKAPEMASFLHELRWYLDVAFGWTGPYTTEQMLA